MPWGPIDLVVSNPPYVFHKDMEQLAPEICRYRVGGTLEKLYWDPSVPEDFCLEKRGVAWRDSSVERRTLVPQPYWDSFCPCTSDSWRSLASLSLRFCFEKR